MAAMDDLYGALKAADAAGDIDGAQKLANYIRAQSTPAAPAPAPQAAPEPSLLSKVGQQVGNAAAGLVRGAGSIGATLLAPTTGGIGQFLSSVRQRGDDMSAGLQTLGADPDSLAFKAGKIGGEVAGSAGAGGAVANVLRAFPAVAAAAPNLLQAIGTAGMSGGATTGATNALMRAGGGAIAGGAQAGLVNPADALGGAGIGAALPGVVGMAGKGLNAVGQVIAGPGISPAAQAGVAAARGAGYVIPPSQANPSLLNRALEGFAGKITTAQNASAKNQVVTNGLAATGVGLPASTQLTPDVLAAVRQQAGKAYDAVGSTGTITPGPAYEQALDQITAKAKQAASGFPNDSPNPLIAKIDALKSPQFDASSAIAKISSLRDEANTAYAAGNKELGAALKSGAGVLEDAIDAHLQSIGAPADMLQGFRDARQLIAKTYSVEKALNPTTGTVNAQQLAGQLQRGKPLSGDLLTAAQFAQQFPKAAQATEKMGSLPGVSPLDFGVSSLGAITGHPMALAGVLARPAARAAALSPYLQNRLATASGPNALAGLTDPLQQLIYRSVPQVASR